MNCKKCGKIVKMDSAKENNTYTQYNYEKCCGCTTIVKTYYDGRINPIKIEYKHDEE